MKRILKNSALSIIIGIILGSITEYALILDISWLIKITQSFTFWGIIMCISSFVSKDYICSLINPILVLSAMNATYYTIRLIMSGYTNIGGWELFTFVGITGSMYIGNIIFGIKELVIHHRNTGVQICNFIFMTICCVISTIVGFKNPIQHNLFYNIGLGIIVGFIIGMVIAKKYLKKKKG